MSEESKKSVHLDLNHDEHPGLYRYAIELLDYPELAEEEYAAVMADLKNPEDDPLYLAAQEKLICSHLGMVLSMAINTSFKYYGLSMEDFVGVGNHAIVERFSYFKPNMNPIKSNEHLPLQRVMAKIRHPLRTKFRAVEIFSISKTHDPGSRMPV